MLALMGSAFAQDLDYCTSSSECNATKYGESTCCSRLTFVQFAENSNLGDFGTNVLGGAANLIPGNHNKEICIQSAFRAALEETMVDGMLNYYDDVRLYRESDAGLTAAFASPEAWIEAWNANLSSMKGLTVKRQCMEEIKPTSGSMQTCGDVKKTYKAAGCCGNPSMPFDQARRLASSTTDDELLESVKAVLRQAKTEGGTAKAKSLAKRIGDIVKKLSA